MIFEQVPRWEMLMVRLFGRKLLNQHGYCLGRVWRGKFYTVI